MNPQVPCRACLACRSGSENICQQRELVGGSRPGGFGEFVAVPASCVHVIDDELDADVAVLAEPVATCIHAFRLSPLALPGTVVVLGAGTIGTLTCIVARLLGAGRIVVSETDEERRGWAARDRGRGGRSRTVSSRPWARVRTSSSTPSDPTRRGPRPSRSCSPAAARSGSGCTTWTPRSRRSISSFASSRSAAPSPTPMPTSPARSSCWPSIRRRSGSRRGPARSRRALTCSSELVAGAGTGGFVKASLAPSGWGSMRFDVLIRGGEVVDPGGGHEGRLDVAIAARPHRGGRPRDPGGVGVSRDRRDRTDRDAGPGRPARARVPQADLLGHRPRPGRLAIRRDDVERRRLGRSADARGVPRLHRQTGEGRDHRLRQHLEHRPRLRRLRVRQPVVPRRRSVPPHGRPQPRSRARGEGADGQPRPARRRRARAAAACEAGGRRVRAAADDAHLVRPAHDRGGAAVPRSRGTCSRTASPATR